MLIFEQARTGNTVRIDPVAVALVVERERETINGPQQIAAVMLHCGACIHLADDADRSVGKRIAKAKSKT